MDNQIYLTYRSKVRNRLDLDVQKEQELNRNKLVTKVITESQTNPVFVHKLNLRIRELRNRADALAQAKPFDERYTVFQIPKASGGFRTLEAPDDELKALQIDIKNFIQKDCKVLCHNAVHSYVKGRNCKTAIEVHQKKHAHWFLKLDIKSFFDNCKQDILYTKLIHIYPFNVIAFNRHISLQHVLAACCYKGALPQGAPTSPILSNLYLLGFDFALSNEFKDRGLCYTRYADDMLISSTIKFKWQTIVDIVEVLLQVRNLHIKKEKTRFGNCNGSNWNLGLMYNKDCNITVGHINKHVMKCMIHNYNRDKDTMSEEDKITARLQINGILGYYKFIEPNYYEAVPFLTE